MPKFELDPRLARDTLHIGDLDLCAVRLMRDSRFPWLVLIPRRADAIELHELSADEREMLMNEVAKTAAALKAVTIADKINIGALGNIVRQLHVHVVARCEGDAAWPGPVWGAGEPIAYAAGKADALRTKLRQALSV